MYLSYDTVPKNAVILSIPDTVSQILPHPATLKLIPNGSPNLNSTQPRISAGWEKNRTLNRKKSIQPANQQVTPTAVRVRRL